MLGYLVSMDTDFAVLEEEVVENPTIRAAYNLAPLHQNKPLRWDYEVDLIGKKVYDKILHLCEACELPILVYGRLLPCKHIFCFHCARKCEASCKRCVSKVQKVEELALGTVYVCSHRDPKDNTKGCHRTYLSQRDLQSHIAHRHLAKPSVETKVAPSGQPQHPLTQQQAAAAAALQASQSVTGHSQSSLLPANSQHSQQAMSSASFMGGMREQHLLSQESCIPGLGGDLRGGPVSSSPGMSQASPDLKQNPMSHGMNFSPSSQTADQGIYRSLDVPSLPHQLQQQQQFQQHQRHQLQSPQQQPQQLSPLMRLSGSPGASKPMQRFNQSSQMTMSSPLLNRPAPHVNPYQVTTSNSPSELQMSTHHQHQQQSAANIHQQQQQNLNMRQQQQSVNLHQQQQQFSGMMPPHSQQQLLMRHGMDQMQQDGDAGDFNSIQSMDNFGNMQKPDHFGSVQNVSNLHNMPTNMDNFNMPQRNAFNSRQDMDNFNAVQKMEKFNIPRTREDFNTMKGGMMDTSNGPPSAQGGSSRNKNVNLITVPIQEEGQYRPLPFVGQTQLPPGAANKNFPAFSSNMPSSNFSPAMNNQTMGGSGCSLSTSPRMQFNRSANPQARLSQPGNPHSLLPQPGNLQSHLSQQGNQPNIMSQQGNLQNRMPQPGNALSNPGLMMNNARAGGIRLGANMPPSVQDALAGVVVQALSRGAGGPGTMMPSPVSLATNNSQLFNAQSTPGHWNNNSNVRPIRGVRPTRIREFPR